MKKVCAHARSIAALSIVLAGMQLLCCHDALALDPALDVSQYAHVAWRARDGFAQGAITSIAQTPDGYLWLGTDFGLYRFDGVRAVPWQAPVGEQLPSNNITELLVARDGTLWISTLGGLASWKDGRLGHYPEVAGQIVGVLLEDRAGTIWFGSAAPGKLCAIQDGKVRCYGVGSFGQGVWGLYEDHNGNLWLSGETGVWRWAPGTPEHYSLGSGKLLQISGFTEDDRGRLLLATEDGLKQLVGGRIQSYALPGVIGQFRPHYFFRSSDGSLWITSNQGLLHLHQGRTDRFRAADGLSGDTVTSVFEDREGNIWASTADGLDQFHEYAIQRISANRGLSKSYIYSMQATSDGTIWFGAADGLTRWQNGKTTVYGGRGAPDGRSDQQELRISGAARENTSSGLVGIPRSLGLDDQGRLWASTSDGVFYFEGDRFIRVPGVAGGNVFGIAGDGQGNVWISDGKLGLFYVTPGDPVQSIPWPQLGRKGFGARALLPDRSQGGVWLGFYEGGLIYFKDGQVQASYSSADGLGSGRVNALWFGSRGALWAAAEGGLSLVRDGRFLTLTSKNGLPCDEVHWSVEDDDHFVWLSTPCGLARIARSELDAWVNDPKRTVQTTIFDNSEGAMSVGVYGGYGPHATKSPDGRIWFAQRDGGVSVIDPRHLPFNNVPPPVHIEEMIADHRTYAVGLRGNGDGRGQIRLPALTRDVQIDYTALSLLAPAKNRFRYKLEGWDSDWQEVGNRRQAFYAGLAPRRYRFRVAACNNSGVWNEAGTFLDFAMAPAYYQTTWFRLSLVAAFLAVLWGLYQLRLRQLAQEFDMRVEERISERTRIARELHDSLLQGFQGLMFRLQAVRDMLPEMSKAAQALDVALERGDKAIAEGRDTVSDLREPLMGDSDIAQALTALGEELAAQSDNGAAPCVRVLVEGEQRGLNPMARDEIYRIAREALRNAFRHAKAQKIEAEITYGESELLMHVRDDGIGIALEGVNLGTRAGHWGLPGMRERAKSFGGKLEVWSEDGAGTEIELSVPGAIAYGKSEPRRRFWSLRKKTEGTDGQQS